MVLAVARLARCLYGEITLDAADVSSSSIAALHRTEKECLQKSRGSAYVDLSSLLGHMAPYFPFVLQSSPLVRREVKVSLLRVNCEKY